MKTAEEYAVLAEKELSNENKSQDPSAHRATILTRALVYATLAVAASADTRRY